MYINSLRNTLFGCALVALLLPAVASAAKPVFKVAKNAPVKLALHHVAGGFASPVLLTHAGDGSGRRFVVEQSGRVWIVEDNGGTKKPKSFLDIRPLVKTGGERGLLGMAFHPQYAQNGQLFVYFTDKKQNIVVARVNTSKRNDNRADPGTLKPLLTIENPAANHNGGNIAFGPDGYLYIGTGDGGGAGDPYQNGQNSYSHLGKILRIDINNRTRKRHYAIPDDNPYVGRSVYQPEIWAYGLRNPWRFSFDRKSGDLFIADVGQDDWEEINYQPAGDPGGQNYGWSFMEGKHCYPPVVNTKKRRKKKCNKGIQPVIEYGHKFGCSVTGGHVYRGARIPKLNGVYLFADYCEGTVWGLIPKRKEPGQFWMRRYLEIDFNISSFGEDENGELYVLDHKGGNVYQIVPKGWKPKKK